MNNERELLKWAKSHLNDLYLGNDKLLYYEEKRILCIEFRNAHKLETEEDELGIQYVKIQVPREGLRSLKWTLNQMFKGVE